MHEDIGTEAMISHRGYSKPWPQWQRVILRAVAVAACMAGVVGGAFGAAYAAVNWPATSACIVAVVVLLIIGYVWDEEEKGW